MIQTHQKELRMSLEEYTREPSVLRLFWLFVFTSVLGVLIETVAYRFHSGMWLCRQGVVYGPFSPVFGVGAVLAVILLHHYRKKNGLFIFTVSAVAGCVFELAASWLQEWILGTRSWDYTYETFLGMSIPNIQGRTSLKMAVYWGIAGYLCIRLLYPLSCMLMERISQRSLRIISICLAVFLAFDIAVSVAACVRQNQRRMGVEAQNGLERYLDDVFPDERLERIFSNTLPADEVSPLALPEDMKQKVEIP